MQSNILISLLISTQLIFISAHAQGQPSEPRMSKVDYVEQYADQAVREMHSSGVPASITLAQGMLESDYGNSPLAKYANNHFGIKCHKGWDGPTFIQDDDERNECFRKYYQAYDSYRDHSEFLRTRDRYASLFDLKQTDYKGWAKGLKKAGYATNPKYADLIIRIIEENELDKYDKLKKLPDTEVIAEVETPEFKSDVPTILNVRSVKVSDNNIKYVVAKQGDTPASIAKQNDMGLWQILKYNDLEKHDPIMSGDIVYLQPKRNYASSEFHTVAAGESLRSISQQHGVKIKRLMKINEYTPNYTPQVGEKVKLRDMSVVNEKLTGR
ncbi:MAG TPA: N-acetylmuramoyl-L-alanine amidase [Flavobacteriales bacterium]|jgi:LysM repeat protein|nr:glucosaminidase domain-containing protein [Flavobacteriales bacterium]HAW20229.1 N-acetylmuramoyl-L-alanine amidase [Flavobacteriales bacterium]